MIRTLSLFTIVLLISVSGALRAQYSNLVVFTQSGEPFTLVMNGIQQSPDPETNIRITGLNAPNYKVRVRFANEKLAVINKTVYLQPETEATYEILRNSKGNWVMRLMNTIPIDEAPEPRSDQGVFVYTTTPRISTTTVSQTTTVSTDGRTGGTTISTTTSQTTSTIAPQEEQLVIGYPDFPAYTGQRGCARPMSRDAFEQALRSIDSKNFESSKLTIAKQVTSANCLLSRQVKEIMKLLTFESDRLEYAKYAYRYTWDLNNYFLLNDAFDFESSIEELNRFIRSSNR